MDQFPAERLTRFLDALNHLPAETPVTRRGQALTVGDLRDVEALLGAQAAEVSRLRAALEQAVEGLEQLHPDEEAHDAVYLNLKAALRGH